MNDDLQARKFQKKDWVESILQYNPLAEEEKIDKNIFISFVEQYGTEVLNRSCPEHVTVSSIILNPQMDAMLMVYHNIYDSYSWTGGHADGSLNFLEKALEEAKEETGAEIIYPYSSAILSLDRLPVIAHVKRGKEVAAHHHLNIAYGFIASDCQELKVKPDENSDVRWIGLDNWKDHCKEPHMIPVYDKIIRRMLELKQKKEEIFAQLPMYLLPWFRKEGRDLPWRGTDNPYHIWLSEIMLQQTRVEAVKGYYDRFLNQLPDIASLAQADKDTVMKLWEGLGYYSRAANLQKAAIEIMELHGGIFPDNYDDIHKLSGIGDYTAGAIASVCFWAPKAAVDGNVLRVISRITEDYRLITDAATKKEYAGLLEKYFPLQENYGEAVRWYNQSLMELGAIVCVPNGIPKCEICPVGKICLANKNGSFSELPKKKEKAGRKIIKKTVFLLRKGKLAENMYRETAVQKRPDTGLLAGLWQLPNVDRELSPQEALDMVNTWGLKPLELMGEQNGKHVFTHLEWHMKCYEILCEESSVPVIEAEAEGNPIVWKSREEIDAEAALPTAFRMFM